MQATEKIDAQFSIMWRSIDQVDVVVSSIPNMLFSWENLRVLYTNNIYVQANMEEFERLIQLLQHLKKK